VQDIVTDDTTATISGELRLLQRRTLDVGRIGDVQRMANDLEELQIIGGRLHELETEMKTLVSYNEIEKASLLEAEFDALVKARLEIAGFWDLPFWEREVALEPRIPDPSLQISGLEASLASAQKSIASQDDLVSAHIQKLEDSLVRVLAQTQMAASRLSKADKLAEDTDDFLAADTQKVEQELAALLMDTQKAARNLSLGMCSTI